MSLVTRGHGSGLLATFGLGIKILGKLKRYLIFKSYAVVYKDDEDIVLKPVSVEEIYVDGRH